MIANSQPNRLRQVGKALGLGPFLYRTYYIPKRFLQECHRRGASNLAIDYWSRRQMEAAAYNLPTFQIDNAQATYEIYFLSGRKFWYQTCFCAYSMAQTAEVNIRPVIYDDGSFTPKLINQIQRIFPSARIVLSAEIEEQIDQHLPVQQFPYLRERRANYPNMRKLTDIHVGAQGWKLVLDSDMLFFRTPDFLLNWLRNPQEPCCMVDTETAYGYSPELMSALTQAELPERVNVGICGLNSSEVNWEKLEFWCKTLIEKEGTHYYQEQALVAMLLTNQQYHMAPAEDYVVMPERDEVIQPVAVLHHYVSDSKPWYFRYGWKHIIKSSYLPQSTKVL